MPHDPRRDPLLQRRPPTDDELEAESRITEEDIADAMAAFDRYAPEDARGLLDAVSASATKPDDGQTDRSDT
jgi:hypothetical protein